ncbi:leucyl aminopeptidase [Georgenia soli]|uniref:Probable cytosol aminopeptidase n=1 Tax=Georgenia soli TaxID=638953 RepID=A0A2A9EP56_9MICO|nr:M17 family metallopeptidase [Georgenia soli]PFG40573.1 leucyl aminopeptidase [Georgenia soli]
MQSLPEIVLPEIVLADERVAHPREGGRWADPVPDALAVPVAPAPPGEDELQPRGGAADVAALYGIDLLAEAERAELSGKAGTTAVVRLPRVLPGVVDLPWQGLPETLVLVGVGDGSPAAARRAGLALGRAAAGLGTVALAAGDDLTTATLRAFAEGFLLSAFRMPRTGRTPAPGRPAPRRLVVLGRVGRHGTAAGAASGGTTAEPGADETLAAARAAARATWLTRLLAATPSSTKNPVWLAEQVADLVRAAPAEGGTLSAVVHDETWLRRQGMEAILAVGGGSVTPPRLVVVTWEPRRADRHVALVGKGISFDTGGLSLKPREAMVPMKTDMAGAAAVLAAVLGAAERGLPVRVTAVLPLAENAMGGASYRPGDVVRTFDGTTVEVSNTDAEGRLVLADALAWTTATVGADAVVDVATLTGAAARGLGRGHAALFSASDDLAGELLAAGEATGEPAWRMPLVEDYRPALDSAVADVAHVATDGHVGGGAVVAALFLQRFAGSAPWAHLDIAGPARAGKGDGELPAAAPTGHGARLLLRWLEGLSAARPPADRHRSAAGH